MVTVSSDGAAVGSGDADFGGQTTPNVQPALNGGFFTGAHSPYPINPAPELIDAVAYKPNAYTPDRIGGNGYVVRPVKHEPNAIFIDGVNIRDIIAGLKTSAATNAGNGATAARPSATTAGVGSQFYDTTIHKPVWSDGTIWRDATGVAA